MAEQPSRPVNQKFTPRPYFTNRVFQFEESEKNLDLIDLSND